MPQEEKAEHVVCHSNSIGQEGVKRHHMSKTAEEMEANLVSLCIIRDYIMLSKKETGQSVVSLLQF